MKPVPAWRGAGLTFNWPDHRHISFALLGWIMLAFLAHGLAFYVFQIVYPPSARIAPPPAQVSLLAPTSAENRELLRWIEAHDPALLAQPQRAAPPVAFDVPYTPSYATLDSVPLVPEPPAAPASLPSALSGSDLIERALRPAPRPPEPVPPIATSIRFNGPLEKMSDNVRPALVSGSSRQLTPARFLIGVEAGSARFIFQQESSGDPAMDAQARAALERAHFSPEETETAWGFAIISWGADAFAEP